MEVSGMYTAPVLVKVEDAAVVARVAGTILA